MTRNSWEEWLGMCKALFLRLPLSGPALVYPGLVAARRMPRMVVACGGRGTYQRAK